MSPRTRSAYHAIAIARAPTGVTPGYSPVLGATVGEDGRLTYVGDGEAQIWTADMTTAQTIEVGAGEVVNFNRVTYEPLSGAGQIVPGAAWAWTAAGGLAWYRVTVTLRVDSNGDDMGDRRRADLIGQAFTCGAAVCRSPDR